MILAYFSYYLHYKFFNQVFIATKLKRVCPVSLFLDFGNPDYESVPDPYYSGVQGFELVLDLVEEASSNLVDHIAKRHELLSER